MCITSKLRYVRAGHEATMVFVTNDAMTRDGWTAQFTCVSPGDVLPVAAEDTCIEPGVRMTDGGQIDFWGVASVISCQWVLRCSDTTLHPRVSFGRFATKRVSFSSPP